MTATDQLEALERRFAAEARQFTATDETAKRPAVTSIIVADLEFIWDRASHRVFAGDKLATVPIRWPFDRVAAACWTRLQFVSGQPVPLIDSTTLMSGEDYDEREIVSALFDALHEDRAATLVMWGSEQRDLPVLRRAAMTHDLVLPAQLRETSPNAAGRTDLCRELTGLGEKAKLAELAASFGIPAKPEPSDQIGKLAELEAWQAVREQCGADVAVTALLAARQLNSIGQISCDPVATEVAIAEAFAAAFPASRFATGTLAGWARGRSARAKLKGHIGHQHEVMEGEEKMT